ncbi:MAG TPA: hypothetical protein VGI39_24445 [Polyangiaceae bacterium]
MSSRTHRLIPLGLSVLLSTLVVIACGATSGSAPDPEEEAVGSTAQDLSSGDATLACRQVSMAAERDYAPPPARSIDGTTQITPAMSFHVPSTVPVTAGDSKDGTLKFSFRLGTGTTITCTYDGAGDCDPAHGGSPAQVYSFDSCNHGITAGAVETADWFQLHVNSGDTQNPAKKTAVSLTLTEYGNCGGGGDAGKDASDGSPVDARPDAFDAASDEGADAFDAEPLDAADANGFADVADASDAGDSADAADVGDAEDASDGDAADATTCDPTECDDGNPCTVDACNPDGTCAHAAASNGLACDDGNACTPIDSCQAGVCTGASPIVCTASDACHVAGVCNLATGICSNPSAPNGTTCSDGNACTQSDSCQAGICAGTNPVTCAASDACHAAGTCDPATGSCSNPPAANGTSCNDGNACTQRDSCQAGVCSGSNPVTCSASDQCHAAGICNPATGTCSNPSAANGTACSDGNACTQSDSCVAGVCTGSNPVTCTASDQCHVAGTCDPSSGACSNPTAANGSACSDGNACTSGDACTGGACAGTPVTCTASDACHVAGTCSPSTGACTTPTQPAGTACGNKLESLRRRPSLRWHRRVRPGPRACRRHLEPVHGRELRSRNRRGLHTQPRHRLRRQLEQVRCHPRL